MLDLNYDFALAQCVLFFFLKFLFVNRISFTVLFALVVYQEDYMCSVFLLSHLFLHL